MNEFKFYVQIIIAFVIFIGCLFVLNWILSILF